jgi:Zn-finger nucleic acid-binding protein
MECPKGHGSLKSVSVGSIQIDRCSECRGGWYDVNKLRLLKDRESSGDYRWIDFDLWKDMDKFRAAKQERYTCPRDGRPMTTVRYGDSPVLVDICSQCKGVWLDGEEYEWIVAYLEKMVNTHSVGDYLKDVRDEFLQIFVGPEGPLSEMRDLGRVLYLLQLRLVIENPRLGTALNSLPRY